MTKLYNLIDQYIKFAQNAGSHPVNVLTQPNDLILDEKSSKFWKEYHLRIPSNFHLYLGAFIGSKLTLGDVWKWFNQNRPLSLVAYPEIRIAKDDDGTDYIECTSGGMASLLRIYKDKNVNPNDMNKVIIKWLRGTDKIPQLYLVSGQKINNEYLNMPKEFAHHYWLYDALRKLLFKKDVDMSSHEFLSATKSGALDNIYRQIDSSPRILGRGADGVAFSIGPDKVLKIYVDDFLFKKTKEDLERLHKHHDLARTEIMIYDVGILFKIGAVNIYYTILKKIKPVSDILDVYLDPLLIKIAKLIMRDIGGENIYFFQAYLPRVEKHKELKNNIISSANEIKNEVTLSPTMNELINKINELESDLKPNWLDLLIEEMIVKFITERGDLHTGNIGITHMGEFRFFDPSHWLATKKINIGNSY